LFGDPSVSSSAMIDVAKNQMITFRIEVWQWLIPSEKSCSQEFASQNWCIFFQTCLSVPIWELRFTEYPINTQKIFQNCLPSNLEPTPCHNIWSHNPKTMAVPANHLVGKHTAILKIDSTHSNATTSVDCSNMNIFWSLLMPIDRCWCKKCR
jgi:hypothetical protein